MKSLFLRQVNIDLGLAFAHAVAAEHQQPASNNPHWDIEALVLEQPHQRGQAEQGHVDAGVHVEVLVQLHPQYLVIDAPDCDDTGNAEQQASQYGLEGGI